MSRGMWWKSMLLAASAAVLGGSVLRPVALQRRVPQQTAAPRAEHGGLVVPGLLGPEMNIPITDPDVRLSVPLNSFVSKGQIIGRSVRISVAPAPGAAMEASEAAPDVDEAEAALASARDNEDAATIQRVLAQAERRRVAAEFEGSGLRFREGALAPNRYYDRLATLTSVEMAAYAAREHESLGMSSLDQAQLELQRARAEIAENESMPAAGIVDRTWFWVTAPADGYLVMRDPVSRTYGIAKGDTKLRVVVQVPAEALFQIRTGQEALVSLDNRPEVKLHATVREISGTPALSASGPRYTVILSVANPDGLPFDTEKVKVLVGGHY